MLQENILKEAPHLNKRVIGYQRILCSERSIR